MPCRWAQVASTEVTSWNVDARSHSRTNNPWAPHSPDINPFDFFLYILLLLKEQVYENVPATREELKEEINRVLQNVTEQNLQEHH